MANYIHLIGQLEISSRSSQGLTRSSGAPRIPTIWIIHLVKSYLFIPVWKFVFIHLIRSRLSSSSFATEDEEIFILNILLFAIYMFLSTGHLSLKM
jgi:hypothetical protein